MLRVGGIRFLVDLREEEWQENKGMDISKEGFLYYKGLHRAVLLYID
jgi:hypothetical protein